MKCTLFALPDVHLVIERCLVKAYGMKIRMMCVICRSIDLEVLFMEALRVDCRQAFEEARRFPQQSIINLGMPYRPTCGYPNVL